MGDLAIKSLFRCVSLVLARQEKVEPPEDQYLMGHLFVWTNVLKRLVVGRVSGDSSELYAKWLTEYRDSLYEASRSDKASGNAYLAGQVDGFNLYLQSFAKAHSFESEEYNAKLHEISLAQQKIDILKSELEDVIWKAVTK